MDTGNIIKSLRESRGITQQQLAEIIGAKTYTTVTKWEKGENFPKGKDIKKLSEYFGVSSDYILGLQELVLPKTSDYSFYPVSVSAGSPLTIDAVTHNEVITLPDSVMGKWAGNESIYMMRINGESMNEIIPHNSLIAVKSVEVSELKDNDIVVFSNGNDYSVKRFYNDRVNERLLFSPESTDRSFVDYIVPYSEAQNLEIHGKVVVYIVELD